MLDLNGLVTTVIITYDYGFGSHAAIHVENNGSPVLYDPGGSYGGTTRGTSDTFFGDEAGLKPFIEYHEGGGSKVALFRFDTLHKEEAAIVEAIMEQGSMSPGLCAVGVCSVLKESNARNFWDLDFNYLFPGNLADDLRIFLDKQGYCL